jgi:hypothetical protein
LQILQCLNRAAFRAARSGENIHQVNVITNLRDVRAADYAIHRKEVIRGLDALQQVEANFQGRRFLFRSQLTADASQSGPRHGCGDTAYFAGTPVTASRLKM